MKIILFNVVMLIAHLCSAQVDSFKRDGTMYYTYDAPKAPVRMFYPKGDLQRCPYCGQMETLAHIKKVTDRYKSTNYVGVFITDTISPEIKRKINIAKNIRF